MSDTPRTDRFIFEHPLRLPKDLAGRADVVIALRDLFIAWAEFSADLEREVNASLPREWLH